jgi:hypothetical protein
MLVIELIEVTAGGRRADGVEGGGCGAVLCARRAVPNRK